MRTPSHQDSPLTRFRAFYGAHPLHLLALLASFALVGYVVVVVGPPVLFDSSVWWQAIIVWFLGAVLLHDLVLFPLYALADRAVTGLLRRRRRGTPDVPVLNYLRVPVLASGLLLLLFFPGIIGQGGDTYLAATGQTQEPFLSRWLLFTAASFAISAIAYAVRVGRRRQHQHRRHHAGPRT